MFLLHPLLTSWSKCVPRSSLQLCHGMVIAENKNIWAWTQISGKKSNCPSWLPLFISLQDTRAILDVYKLRQTSAAPFAAEGRESRQSSHMGLWRDDIEARQCQGQWLWYTPCRLQWHWVTLPLGTPWKMLPEEERLFPFHFSTDEAFRESLSSVESAIFLPQFAAGIFLSAFWLSWHNHICPCSTLTKGPLAILWYHHLTGSHCSAFPWGRQNSDYENSGYKSIHSRHSCLPCFFHNMFFKFYWKAFFWMTLTS